MKRILECVLVAGLFVAGMAVPAAAAPHKTVRDAVDLNCIGLSAAGGTAFLQVSTRPDGGAFTTVWRPGAPESEPWLSGATTEAVLNGTALRATIPLTDLQSGAEHGEGVVDVVFAAAGAPVTTKVRGGEGNVQSRSTTTTTPATATGTFVVDGVGTFDLAGCGAELLHVESFITNPAAYVQNLATHVEIDCTFQGAGHDVFLYAEGFIPGDRGEVELSVWQVPSGGEVPDQGGGGVATLTRSTLTAAVELIDAGGESVGTASVDARLAVTGRSRTRSGDGTATYSTRSETLALVGALSLPDGRALPLRECAATRQYGQQRIAPAR